MATLAQKPVCFPSTSSIPPTYELIHMSIDELRPLGITKGSNMLCLYNASNGDYNSLKVLISKRNFNILCSSASLRCILAKMPDNGVYLEELYCVQTPRF